jgi:LysM repeat protein
VLDSATLKKVHGKKNEVITPNYLASELRKRLDFEVEFKEVRVDGETLGIIADEAILEDLMAKLKRKYLRGYEGEIAFNKEIELVPVFAKEEALSELDELYQACIKKNTEEFDYTVASGDTLWAIANKHDITVPRLLQANEGMTETTPLKVGQTLNIKREVPVLKVVEVAVVSN